MFYDLAIEETLDGAVVEIKVIPKGRRNEIIGIEENSLKVRVAAVPEKGKANEELLSFLAKSLSIPKRDIFLLSGLTSRHKKILFARKTPSEVRKKLFDVFS